MEFFKIRRTIPFMRHALIFNVISLITFIAAVFFIAHRGLNLSIEFTGGTLIEVGYKESADVDAVRRALEQAGYKAEAQNFGSSRDVVIILGFFAFFQWEFSLPVLAAVLAVLGYSVNESVVVFDRVRENFRKMRKASTPEVIDSAITGVISRTIITHGCTQMMVTTMLIFGGQALHYFALALTIGILFGIYSSVLVASPLVMWLGAKREQFIKPTRKGRHDEHEGAVV